MAHPLAGSLTHHQQSHFGVLDAPIALGGEVKPPAGDLGGWRPESVGLLPALSR